MLQRGVPQPVFCSDFLFNDMMWFALLLLAVASGLWLPLHKDNVEVVNFALPKVQKSLRQTQK